jgi:hypothetical protein
VQVPHSEEVANHAVLESCVASPRGAGEALTEACIGQPLSREIDVISGAHAFKTVEGNITRRDTASALWTRRGRRPWHVRTLLEREPGDLQSDHWVLYGSVARIGKAKSRSR